MAMKWFAGEFAEARFHWLATLMIVLYTADYTADLPVALAIFLLADVCTLLVVLSWKSVDRRGLRHVTFRLVSFGVIIALMTSLLPTNLALPTPSMFELLRLTEWRDALLMSASVASAVGLGLYLSRQMARASGGRAFADALVLFATWMFVSGGLLIVIFHFVRLGPRVSFPVILAAVTGAVVVLGTRVLIRKVRSASGAQSPQGRRFAALLYVFVFVLVGGTTGGIIITERVRRGQFATKAASHFRTSAVAEIPPSRLERSLAELEMARAGLSDTFLVTDRDTPDAVVLHQDAFDPSDPVNRLAAQFGAVRCTADGPRILLTAEKAGHLETITTPRHEMVHALMCRVLGKSAMDRIPRWFHEGVATFYEHENFRQSRKRSARRISVWLAGDSLFLPADFCNRSRIRPSEVKLFYATAGEFIDVLVERHGPEFIPNVAYQAAETMDFEGALKEVAGTDCAGLYGEWTATISSPI